MKSSRSVRSLAVLTALAAACVCFSHAGEACAHPFHTSVAETEWNSETKRLEVALRVSPEDLETALSKQGETKVRLEDSEGIDDLIVDYLNDHFTLCKPKSGDEDPQPLELKWTGKELSTKAAWLFFEIEAPDGVEGLELANRLLLDEGDSQINTVVLRDGKRKTTLRFDKKHVSEVVRFDDSAKPSD